MANCLWCGSQVKGLGIYGGISWGGSQFYCSKKCLNEHEQSEKRKGKGK
jgi:hypothetical protein